MYLGAATPCIKIIGDRNGKSKNQNQPKSQEVSKKVKIDIKKKRDRMQHKVTCGQKNDVEKNCIRLLKKYQQSPSKIKF